LYAKENGASVIDAPLLGCACGARLLFFEFFSLLAFCNVTQDADDYHAEEAEGGNSEHGDNSPDELIVCLLPHTDPFLLDEILMGHCTGGADEAKKECDGENGIFHDG